MHSRACIPPSHLVDPGIMLSLVCHRNATIHMLRTFFAVVSQYTSVLGNVRDILNKRQERGALPVMIRSYSPQA